MSGSRLPVGLDGGWLGYTVTVSVSDGVDSRNLAVASDLRFDKGSASWTPLAE